MEETTITLIDPKPIHVHSRMLEIEKWFHFTLWVCDDFTGNIVLSNEHIAYEWVDKQKLSELKLRETVGYVLLEILKIMK
jgi:hypothetical protein